MKRKLLAPEVVQTSAMDCGPAALKCLLEGHGIHVSYGRLREACQTDVDGTSIDTLEQTARLLGLEAEQVMLPVDHLLQGRALLLPALVVVVLPGGATHFVVVWRKHGNLIQVMDPAVGRRWISEERFTAELYRHTQSIPADVWRSWARSRSFLGALEHRLRDLGATREQAVRLVEFAMADAGWEKLARLDAAVRMVQTVQNAGAVRRGRESLALAERIATSATSIPDRYWSARQDPDNPDHLLLSGAVLVTVKGRSEMADDKQLPAELQAAVKEHRERPLRHLWAMAKQEGWLAPIAIVIALMLAAGTVVVEALLLRGLFEVGRDLSLSGQRLGAIVALASFLAILLAFDAALSGSLLRLGRKMECRFRAAFLHKIPRLGDRYFRSRLISDMADRSHSVYLLRSLPELAGSLLRNVFELTLTIAAIVWLFPAAGPAALIAGLLALLLPILAQPALAGHDMRARTHGGALGRFYLDAMLGLLAIRAHAAERSLRREQQTMLGAWAGAALQFQRAVVSAEALQLAASLGCAVWMIAAQLRSQMEPAGILLLAYWALNVPALGRNIAAIAWRIPSMHNITLRLVEPLGAPEEEVAAAPSKGNQPKQGVAISLRNVTVRAAGHLILDDVSLEITAGARVGIVGASGAGKSSLVGVLLGWHTPSSGEALVDGEPLDASAIAQLRGETAWVDPQVQLWGDTLLNNLRYGARPQKPAPLEPVLSSAHLDRVIQKLPQGLQTCLGEGGALVSGGEGQRVRLGRAMLRPGVRLVILDEPARGLDRERRRAMLDNAREKWPDATMLCITHDVSDTLDLERVLVMEGGRVIEDGNPHHLAARDSRYRQLLDAEHAVRTGMWSGRVWRKMRLTEGKLVEMEREEVQCAAR